MESTRLYRVDSTVHRRTNATWEDSTHTSVRKRLDEIDQAPTLASAKLVPIAGPETETPTLPPAWNAGEPRNRIAREGALARTDHWIAPNDRCGSLHSPHPTRTAGRPGAVHPYHRGNGPIGGDKYIAASWVLFRRHLQWTPLLQGDMVIEELSTRRTTVKAVRQSPGFASSRAKCRRPQTTGSGSVLPDAVA